MASLYAPAVESARWRYQNLIVWDKGNPGLGTGFRPQHELALHFSKGAPKYHSATFGNVLSVPRVRGVEREHQTQKPLRLIWSILDVVSAPGQVVLDPFMGSGTTLVAAARMGRVGIGIEVDPQHFETACRRVEDALKHRTIPMALGGVIPRDQVGFDFTKEE